MAELSAKDREKLDKGSFAFPDQEKEPLENASHVRNAIARFNQVKGVSDDDRDAAWKRIMAAANLTESRNSSLGDSLGGVL